MERQVVPLILKFLTPLGENKVHMYLGLGELTLQNLPILRGKLNPLLNKGMRPDRVRLSLSPIQKQLGYLVELADVQVALCFVTNSLKYMHDKQCLDRENHAIVVRFCTKGMVDFKNVYRILHYLMPQHATSFLGALFREVRLACCASCFGTDRHVSHVKMVSWLGKFLTRYFVLKSSCDELSYRRLNRIKFWDILVGDLWMYFKDEIFHLSTLDMSQKCDSLFKEIKEITDRDSALKLVHSFKSRCQ